MQTQIGIIMFSNHCTLPKFAILFINHNCTIKYTEFHSLEIRNKKCITHAA